MSRSGTVERALPCRNDTGRHAAQATMAGAVKRKREMRVARTIVSLVCFIWPQMGFILQDDGVAPEHPSVFCIGAANGSGRGWAWHDNRRRQHCFSSALGDMAASADLVASAICAADIDGMLSLAQLAQEMPGIISRLFPRQCPACGGNHYKRAAQIKAAVKHIHDGAVKALRAAHVPEYLMRYPYLCDDKTHDIANRLNDASAREKLPTDAATTKLVRRILRTRGNLPVWIGDPSRTKLMQIGYAHRYRLKKGM